ALHGVVDRRLLDANLLEAPLEGRVALEVLAVLVERRRADRLQLAAREGRLEDRGRVDRALGRARADEVVQLVDEQDDVAPLHDLLHDLLEALLELAAVLRSRAPGRAGCARCRCSCGRGTALRAARVPAPSSRAV